MLCGVQYVLPFVFVDFHCFAIIVVVDIATAVTAAMV